MENKRVIQVDEKVPVNLLIPLSIQHLLAMTPHYWRITKDGAARLVELTRLDDRVSAIMNVYRREAGCGFTFPGFSGTMQANTGR